MLWSSPGPGTSRPCAWSRLASRQLRALAYLFNVHTLLLAALGCCAVAACEHFGLSFNMDFNVVALGLTFPLTFAIQSAFTRRERALALLAELKATLVALCWLHRDWAQGPSFPATLGDNAHAWAREFGGVAVEFADAVAEFLGARVDDDYESAAEVRIAAKPQAVVRMLLASTSTREAELGESFIRRVSRRTARRPGYTQLHAAYACLSRMSVMQEYLCFKAGYTRGGEGGLSRASQYLRYLVAQMDGLVKIKEYRTPAMLRAACGVLVHLAAVLLAPYWLHVGVCDDTDRRQHGAAGGGGGNGDSAWCVAPYVTCVTFTLFATLLLNVQAGLEHPFAGSSIDDILVRTLPADLVDVLDLPPAGGALADSGDCFDAVRETARAERAAAAAAAAAANGGSSADASAAGASKQNR